jgi:hypothetical protein
MATTTLTESVSSYLLRYRKITAVKAFELCGTMRLSAIIMTLRSRGWPIETEFVETTNRYGKPIRYGVYTLPKGWKPENNNK